MSMIFTGNARLGRDAELRFTNSGEPVATLSLATEWGKRDNEGKRKVQWIEAGLWGKRAESLSEHLKRGQLVWVVLEDVHEEEFERRDGTKDKKLASRVGQIEFAGPKPQEQDGAPASRPAPSPAPAARRGPASAPKPSAGFDDMDDDLPF